MDNLKIPNDFLERLTKNQFIKLKPSYNQFIYSSLTHQGIKVVWYVILFILHDSPIVGVNDVR